MTAGNIRHNFGFKLMQGFPQNGGSGNAVGIIIPVDINRAPGSIPTCFKLIFPGAGGEKNSAMAALVVKPRVLSKISITVIMDYK